MDVAKQVVMTTNSSSSNSSELDDPQNAVCATVKRKEDAGEPRLSPSSDAATSSKRLKLSTPQDDYNIASDVHALKNKMENESIRKENSANVADSIWEGNIASHIKVTAAATTAAAATTTTHGESPCRRRDESEYHLRQHCPEFTYLTDLPSWAQECRYRVRRRMRQTEEKECDPHRVTNTNATDHSDGATKEDEEEMQKAKEPNLRDNHIECCEACLCLVCGIPAKQCTNWTEHCSKYVDSEQGHWLWKRHQQKQKQKSSVSSSGDGDSHNFFEWLLEPYEFLSQDGPFPPDTFVPTSCRILTQCRHCGWYNKFCHWNYEFFRWKSQTNSEQQPSWNTLCDSRAPSRGMPLRDDARNSHDEIHPVGPLDWCHACGRVACERDLAKLQSQPFRNETNSILLGARTIRFRLHTHDPRHMERYPYQYKHDAYKSVKANWKKNTHWKWNDQDMEEELFLHRFGERPWLSMILASLPIEDDIRSISPDGRTPEGHTVSLSETEAMILLDGNKNDQIDHKDRLWLSDLHDIAPSFGLGEGLAEEYHDPIDGDIQARWDKKTSTGVSVIHYYLGHQVSHSRLSWSRARTRQATLLISISFFFSYACRHLLSEYSFVLPIVTIGESPWPLLD